MGDSGSEARVSVDQRTYIDKDINGPYVVSLNNLGQFQKAVMTPTDQKKFLELHKAQQHGYSARLPAVAAAPSVPVQVAVQSVASPVQAVAAPVANVIAPFQSSLVKSFGTAVNTVPGLANYARSPFAASQLIPGQLAYPGFPAQTHSQYPFLLHG